MVRRVAGFLERRPKKRLDNYLAWSRAFDLIRRKNNKKKCDFSREELFSILEEGLFEAFESIEGRVLTGEEEDMLRGRIESLKRLQPEKLAPSS